MDKLKAIRFFVLVAEQGNIANACKLTGAAPPTVSKALARLEQELKCQLFIRSTRNFTITPEGAQYLETARSVLAALEQGEAALSSSRETLSGVININLPVSYGRLYITPILRDFCALHPGIALNIQYNDAYVDIINQGIDLTIRSGTVQNSRLICQRISPFTEITCASPDYLNRHGAPKSLEDLPDHNWIRFRFKQTGAVFPVMADVDGQIVELDPNRQIVVDDGEAMAELCAMGLGLTQVPHFIARKWLESGELLPVLPITRLPDFGIYLLYPRRDFMPARTLALIDHIKTALRQMNETPHATWADQVEVTQAD